MRLLGFEFLSSALSAIFNNKVSPVRVKKTHDPKFQTRVAYITLFCATTVSSYEYIISYPFELLSTTGVVNFLLFSDVARVLKEWLARPDLRKTSTLSARTSKANYGVGGQLSPRGGRVVRTCPV